MTYENITKDELKGLVDNDEVEVLNVLSKDNYDNLHIKGSRSFPLDELKDKWEELDTDKTYVVYCANYDCQASPKAAQFLDEKGLDVMDYEGGIQEWAEEGLPVEGKQSREEFLAAGS